MIRTEWKKLGTLPILWITLLFLLLANGYVQVEQTNSRYYTPENYRAFFTEIQGKSLAETDAWIEEKMEAISQGTVEAYPMVLLYDMQEFLGEIQSYPDYLSGISQQADSMTSVSIWGGTDTFSYRNIQKTPAAYATLEGTTLQLEPSLGIEDATGGKLSDGIGVFLVFWITIACFLRDREQGILPLLYATKNGRGRLFSAKWIASAFLAAGIALLLVLENLCIGGVLYGVGDLSRPIQCVFGFYTCNLPISVLEYLFLFAGWKMLTYAAFSAVFSCCCVAAENVLLVYGLSGAFCLGTWLLYQKISVVSSLQLLHFWNPVQALYCNAIWGTYQNVNLLGYPVSLKVSALLWLVLLAALGYCSGRWLFCRRRNMHAHQPFRAIFAHRKIRVHSHFFYVAYRGLVLQKGAALLLGLVLVTGIWTAGLVRQYDNSDIYYENFTTSYAGAVTEETTAFLAEKRQLYAETEAALAELEAAGSENWIAQKELSAKLQDRDALERFANRVDAIADNGGEIFYDTGYERLFGIDGNSENLWICFLMTLCLTLLLSPMPAIDRKTQMFSLICSTASGKSGYRRNLLWTSALSGIFAAFVTELPYLWRILSRYGTQGLTAPVQSLTAFATCSLPISLGGMILLGLLLRSGVACGVAIGMTALSGRTRSPVTACLLNLSVFVLPIALALLGAEWFRWIGVTPFLEVWGLLRRII